MTNEAAQAGEREAFEAWWREWANVEVMDLHRKNFPFTAYADQPYACHETGRAWAAWQARAALPAVQPAESGEVMPVYLQSTATTPEAAEGEQSAAHAARTDLVPGVMRCAKCNFKLNRINLNVNVGTVTAGDNKTEPCPNGCGPLWPVTWEQEAREGYVINEQMFDRAIAAEKALAATPAPAHPLPVAGEEVQGNGYCGFCELNGHWEEECQLAKNRKAGGVCSVIFGVVEDGRQDPYPLFLEDEGWKAREFVKKQGGRIVEYRAVLAHAAPAGETKDASK